MATSVAGQPHESRLFYVLTTILSFVSSWTQVQSEVSIIHPSRADRAGHKGTLSLQAANGSDITTFGVRSLTLDLGLCRTFRFVIADVHQPILGADFLFHLACVWISGTTPSLTPPHKCKFKALIVYPDSPWITRFHKVSSNPFSDLLDVTKACTSDCPVKHNVTHHIQTIGSPVVGRPRRLWEVINAKNYI